MAPPDDDPEERTTATGLARFAHEYLTAAFAVVAAHGRQRAIEHSPPVPALYLLGHAIELTLKAYMREHGATIRQLRKLGHDLCACLEHANARRLPAICLPTPEQLAALQVLNNVYEAKELEYIRTGFTRWPRYELAEALALSLFNAVAPQVGYPRTMSVPTDC